MSGSNGHDDGRIDRRSVLRGLGAGATATAIAGCTGGGDGSGGSGGDGSGGSGGGGGTTMGDTSKPTLDMWLGYYTEGEVKREYTDQMIKQFEQQTGITVNIQGVPYADMVTKFRAARAAGNLPDLIEVMTNPGVIAGGGARQINDLFKSMELSDVISQSVMNPHYVWGKQATGTDGALVTIPLGVRPYLTCWRTDWLEQAGIPKEQVNYKAGQLSYQDDLPGIYQKLMDTELGQQKGYFPDATGMKQSDEEYLSNYIPQFGGSLTGVVTEDGSEAAIDSEEARAAISMQKEFVEKGYFDANAISMGDEEATTKHWAGKIAVNHVQDSTDLWAGYLSNKPKLMKNGGFTWGLPYSGGADAGLSWLPAIAFVDGQFNNQAKLDAAGKLLDFWVADKDRAVQNSKKLGFVPPTPDAIKKRDFYSKTDYHKEFWQGAALKTVEEVSPSTIPAVPGNTAITYKIPNKMHQRIMQQGMSVEEATSKAATEINNVLANKRS